MEDEQDYGQIEVEEEIEEKWALFLFLQDLQVLDVVQTEQWFGEILEVYDQGQIQNFASFARK